jgi:steroid 5-alpha reductase family enzyme
VTIEIWSLLGTNLVVMVVVLSLASIPSFRSGDPSYVDGLWGLGFVLVALASVPQTGGDAPRRALLVGLTAAWGLRLGGYLLWRWRRNGPDPRYQRMLRRNRGNQALFLWTRVFLTQSALLTVVALPVQLGQVYDRRLTPLNLVGAAVALFGIVFETVADAQLTRFRGDPTNQGQVMDRGLWRYTRHPNYFGEACVWWGLGGLAVVNAPTVAALLGPLVITVLLLKWSGAGPLESQLKRTKPQYADYIRRTSGFVPLPPKTVKVRA